MGDGLPEKPVIFLKPPSVLLSVDVIGNTVAAKLPANPPYGICHHECEVVVRIKKGGHRLTSAQDQIESLTLGLDMTLRELQVKQKKQGHPWTTSKVFEHSAIVGPWISPSRFPTYSSKEFSLSIAGSVRQHATTNDMLMKIEDAVQYVSQFFPLYPGDLLFTGTPGGVGPVNPGDRALLSWGEIHYEVVWE